MLKRKLKLPDEKEFYYNEYITLRKSTNQIARELNCFGGSVREKLIKFNIPIRSLSESQLGKMNSNWVGDKIKFTGLHEWVRRHKPKPLVCEICKDRPPRDLANISQEYKRDINDFEWLCRSCHMNKDGRINLLHSKKFKYKCFICSKELMGYPKQKICSYECLLAMNRLRYKRDKGGVI